MSDLRDAVLRHVPMDYLQRHDVPGATGPTEACNVSAALKDYAEDRWKLIDRLKAEKDVNRVLLEALIEAEKHFGPFAGITINGQHDPDDVRVVALISAAIAKAGGAS